MSGVENRATAIHITEVALVRLRQGVELAGLDLDLYFVGPLGDLLPSTIGEIVWISGLSRLGERVALRFYVLLDLEHLVDVRWPAPDHRSFIGQIRVIVNTDQ